MCNSEMEYKEELERISKMNPYERLAYIRDLAMFKISVSDVCEEKDMDFYERLLLVTKGYEKR